VDGLKGRAALAQIRAGAEAQAAISPGL
jgi:hypothetical protein